MGTVFEGLWSDGLVAIERMAAPSFGGEFPNETTKARAVAYGNATALFCLRIDFTDFVQLCLFQMAGGSVWLVGK